MSYATLLVHVQPDPSMQYRLRIACDLAKRFDAMIVGIAVEMIRAAPFDDGYTSMDAQWFTAMRETALESQKTCRAQFDLAAADVSKGTLWVTGLDFPAAAIARTSSAADLIVTSQAPNGRRDSYIDAHAAELALISGRPVLVAPPNAAHLAAKRIVLAWKDVREARRAASDAMPFLKAAERVLVLEVCKTEDVADAEVRTADVVAALTRHGVAAEGKITVGRLSDGAEIIHATKVFGADLIVCGAYGHTRLSEWAFGGVTRELLKQESCFVLLSH